MLYAEVMEYKDIDVYSWKWGDVRRTHQMGDLDELLSYMREHPADYGVVVLPPAGSPKYAGHHGAINASDTLMAAGIVPSSMTMVTLLKEPDNHWQDDVARLANVGATIVSANSLDPSVAPTVLEHMTLVVTDDRPPIVSLYSGSFSDEGMGRYARSVESTLTRTFITAMGCDDVEAMRAVFSFQGGLAKVTCGHVSGWWDDVLGTDGFGAWTLAKTRVMFEPMEGAAFPDRDVVEKTRCLGVIWGTVLKRERANNASRMDVERVLETSGVKPMMDAYVAGVPLEDIIA